MVHWAWLILAFVAGQVSLIVVLAFFRGAADKVNELPEGLSEEDMAEAIREVCNGLQFCTNCPLLDIDNDLCFSDGADIPENYRLMKEAGLIK